MTNSIPEKLLALLKEAEEKGNLKIDVLPIPNNVEEDMINSPVVDYEDLIRDQVGLELLLLLHKDLSSYEFAKVVEAVKLVRNVQSLSEIRIPKQEKTDE